MPAAHTSVPSRCITHMEKMHFMMNQLTEALGKNTTLIHFPAKIYLFKINNKNIRKRCEICSKVIVKTPE